MVQYLQFRILEFPVNQMSSVFIPQPDLDSGLQLKQQRHTHNSPSCRHSCHRSRWRPGFWQRFWSLNHHWFYIIEHCRNWNEATQRTSILFFPASMNFMNFMNSMNSMIQCLHPFLSRFVRFAQMPPMAPDAAWVPTLPAPPAVPAPVAWLSRAQGGKKDEDN